MVLAVVVVLMVIVVVVLMIVIAMLLMARMLAHLVIDGDNFPYTSPWNLLTRRSTSATTQDSLSTKYIAFYISTQVQCEM